MAIANIVVEDALRRVRSALIVLTLVSGCAEAPRVIQPDEAIAGLTRVSAFPLDDGTIASAALTLDKRVLVFARPNILAVFDTLGVRQATIGRGGSGPGEFRVLTWAAPGGTDSIWAYDFQQRRLNLFGADGAYLDSWRVEGASTPNVVARLRSGAALLIDPFMPMPARSAGLSVDTVTVLSLLPSRTTPTRVTRIPWSTRFQSSGSVALIAQPLGPIASIAAGDSSFFVAFGDRAEIIEYDGTGRIPSRRSLDLQPRAISDAELAWARALADRPSTLDGIPDLLRAVPLPSIAPVIAGVRVDGQRLWVKSFAVADSIPTMWYAFSASGTRIDSLSIPAGTQLLDIRERLVLLKVAAPSGEESVALYRRASAGTP